jgi:hypothetical protein
MGLQSKNMANLRVLEITVLADVSDNAFLVSAVKSYYDGINGTGFDVKFETDAAPGGNPATIELGEALQGHSILRIKGTIQA